MVSSHDAVQIARSAVMSDWMRRAAWAFRGHTMRAVQRAADDATLLARARDGDLDAFGDLVRRYEHRVRGVLRRLLDDDRDIEEATQDVFVQAWRALARFRGESAVFTWLYRIAVNEALMRRRRRRVAVVELDEAAERRLSQDSELSEPEAAAGDAAVREFLLARLRALPFEYRAPLVLRDLEGLSNEEVADVLGLSVPAAKSRIHRARLRIRAELDAWERGG
jgi:RNA polymerase sigma-70 factor (ECF subfamily)